MATGVTQISAISVYIILNTVHPGSCGHPVHSAADSWPVSLDSEEEIQALPGAASRPLQAQDDGSFAAPGKVSVLAC